MTKTSHKDVLEYFDEVGADMAELILGIIKDKLEAKEIKRQKISANLKKARAARGSKAEAANAEVAAPTAPTRRPGRPARVEDPNAALTTAAGQ